MGLTCMGAGGKGVQAVDAMHQAQINQKFQCAIGYRGLLAKTISDQTVQHLIGAHGTVILKQNLQRALAHWGQADTLFGAQAGRLCQGVGTALAVIVWLKGVGHFRLLTCYDITYDTRGVLAM